MCLESVEEEPMRPASANIEGGFAPTGMKGRGPADCLNSGVISGLTPVDLEHYSKPQPFVCTHLT